MQLDLGLSLEKGQFRRWLTLAVAPVGAGSRTKHSISADHESETPEEMQSFSPLMSYFK